VARSLDEHIAQLERTVTHPGERSEILAAFVGTFVRPFGLDDRATDRLCDVIEDVAQHVSPSHVDAGLAHTALANGRRRS
jgi:hypothetical protein